MVSAAALALFGTLSYVAVILSALIVPLFALYLLIDFDRVVDRVIVESRLEAQNVIKGPHGAAAERHQKGRERDDPDAISDGPMNLRSRMVVLGTRPH